MSKRESKRRQAILDAIFDHQISTRRGKPTCTQIHRSWNKSASYIREDWDALFELNYLEWYHDKSATAYHVNSYEYTGEYYDN